MLEGQVESIVSHRHAEPASGVQDTPSEAPRRIPVADHRARSPAAGERAAVTQAGIQTNSGPTIEAVAAWTQRRLVFRDQPRGPCSRSSIAIGPLRPVLDDPAPASMRISGVFDSNDPDLLLRLLRSLRDRAGRSPQRRQRTSVPVCRQVIQLVHQTTNSLKPM